MPTQEIDRPGSLHESVKILWRKACEWDKIEPKGTFVVFSRDNPYAVFYDTAMRMLLGYDLTGGAS